MFTIHSCLVFHLGQSCVIFYGQLDDTVLDENVLGRVFEEGLTLLIGQGRKFDVGGEQFVAINHEDIVTCLHLGNFKEGEQEATNLVSKIGKQFKNHYQPDIDEFQLGACDIDAAFGEFASILAKSIQDFLGGPPVVSSHRSSVEPKPAPEQAQHNVPSVQRTCMRFPGGIIPPEEIDEVLFQEYQELASMYNVDMIGNVVSKVRAFIYANVGVYHEIEVDFSSYPNKPTVTLPLGVVDVVSSSKLYRGWNPEAPHKIVDLVSELEQLIGISKQKSSAGVDSVPIPTGKATVAGKQSQPVDEGPSPSSLFADRLLYRSRPGKPQEEEEPREYITPAPVTDLNADSPTGLMEDAWPVTTVPVENDVPGPPPVKEPEKPKMTFVIKPRFKPVDELDDDVHKSGDLQEHHAPDQVTPPPRASPPDMPPAKPAPGLLVVRPATAVKPVARQSPTFAIPSVDDLDTFSPVTDVKRPELKPLLLSPADRATPKVVSQPPASVPAKTAPAKPASKPKDDGLFSWDDDGTEMEVKQVKHEIEEPDFKIKKIS